VIRPDGSPRDDMHEVGPRRWAPRLLVATLVVVPLVGATMGGKHVNVWASIMMTMFAATMAAHSIDSLRTGQAVVRPFNANRAQEPRWFWAHVVLHFLVAALCLLSLIVIWRE
jgi:hypothetical protein